MFKTKRRKELEAKELELQLIHNRLNQLEWYLAYEKPEIGFACLYIKGKVKYPSADLFRTLLLTGRMTFEKYRAEANK